MYGLILYKVNQCTLIRLKHFGITLEVQFIVRGKGEYDFKGWIEKDYTVDELINLEITKTRL